MVEATVVDGTGKLTVAFSTSPGSSTATGPGNALLVQGVVQPGGKLRLSGHAPTQLQPGFRRGRRDLPPRRRANTSTQIAALVQQHLGRAARPPGRSSRPGSATASTSPEIAADEPTQCTPGRDGGRRRRSRSRNC